MRNFILVFAALLSASAAVSAQTKIDAARLEKMLQQDKSVQLVDVRTAPEVQQTGKIAGARVLDYSDPNFQANVSKLDRKKPVVVYCAAGGRSPRAAALLAQLGFERVFDYAGGMNDWKAKGKKTVR